MVPQWPVRGYKMLIEQSLPTEKDAARLGFSSFYHLVTVRDEALRTTKEPNPCDSSEDSSGFDYAPRIRTLISDGHLEGAEESDGTNTATKGSEYLERFWCSQVFR